LKPSISRRKNLKFLRDLDVGAMDEEREVRA
jgi:hypothetical protein